MDDTLITKISKFFIKNFRTTILLFFSILVLGFFSYTSFLQREGFPEIEFPGALITTTYFVEDSKVVDEEITLPIVREIQSLDFVDSVSSFSNSNISNISISFKQDITSSDGAKKVSDSMELVKLPEGSSLDIQTFDSVGFGGENDVLISVFETSEGNLDLLDFAEKLAFVIEEQEEVLVANVIYPKEERVNPITGETEIVEARYSRVGFKNNGDIDFTSGINIGIQRADSSVSTIELSDAIEYAISSNKIEGKEDLYDVSFVLDQSIELNKQIESLENNALLGLLGVFAVLLIFINFRASVIAGVFIPTVLALTFLGLYLSGNTLNIISLFSVILILGLFVDDAIVVVEAIDYQKKKGKKGLEAISSAINSIGAADVIGTITTIVVFIPMLAISGVLGDFVRLIPITVIIALTSSIFIALTIIPFLSKIGLSYRKPNKKRKFFVRCFTCFIPIAVDKLADLNSKFVKYYLKRPVFIAISIIFSLFLVVIGGYYATQLKFSIFPLPKDADNILVTINNSSVKNLEDAIDNSQKFEDYLQDNFSQEIDSVGTIIADLNEATYYFRLAEERDITALEIESSVNNWFEKQEDFSGRAVIISAGPPASEFQFSAQIFSEDEDSAIILANDIADFIPEIELPDFIKIEEIFVGDVDVITRSNSRQYLSIQVKINDPTYTGIIPLLENGIKQEFDSEKIEDYGLSEDSLSFDQGSEDDNIQSFNDVIFVGIFSLFIIYIILVSQFKSFTLPFIILLAIPFAMAGLYPGLYYTDNALSFFVMLGHLGLIGIVINNIIIVLDSTIQERNKGINPIDAISNAIKIRFRPLVATTFTTLVGLTPLALTDPFWEPLAFTIIFGLLSSTFISLISIPAYYYIVELLRIKIRTRFVRF